MNYMVKVLRSAVIDINGNPSRFGKGAVVSVSEEVLRDNWELMQVVETATIKAPERRIIEAKPIEKKTRAKKAK